jgi:hypothetical protein
LSPLISIVSIFLSQFLFFSSSSFPLHPLQHQLSHLSPLLEPQRFQFSITIEP